MQEKIKQKLHSPSGETIAETLFAMMVIVLGVLALSGSVMAASRINARVKNQDTAVIYDGSNKISNAKVTIDFGGGIKKDIEDAEVYQTVGDTAYYYIVYED